MTPDRETPTETSRPVFEDLSLAEAPPECPYPDDAGDEMTAEPILMPGRMAYRESAVDRANRIEAAYVENMAIENASGGGSTSDIPVPTHDVAERSAIQQTGDSWVVHLEYERYVDPEGRYTVNYYLEPGDAVRAEVGGYRYPGPHPTEEGFELVC